MATAVDAALLEVEAQLAELAPRFEGLLDYSRLDIQEATRFEVDAATVEHQRRIDRLTSAKVALERLLEDGYPALPPREVTDTVLADLEAQHTTIEAALARFVAGRASALGLSATRPEPR